MCISAGVDADSLPLPAALALSLLKVAPGRSAAQ
jgi:hypothetical protein